MENLKHRLKIAKANLDYYQNTLNDESAIIEYVNYWKLNLEIYKEHLKEQIENCKRTISFLENN
jgi:hypothetical protein